MTLQKVCTELGIRFGQSKDDVKVKQTSGGINNPTNKQSKEALDWSEEEHQAIIFLYKAN